MDLSKLISVKTISELRCGEVRLVAETGRFLKLEADNEIIFKCNSTESIASCMEFFESILLLTGEILF